MLISEFHISTLSPRLKNSSVMQELAEISLATLFDNYSHSASISVSQPQLQLLRGMEEITYSDYLEYKSNHKKVIVGSKELSLEVKPSKILEPVDFEVEKTTVWSYPKRGDWATHKHNNKYRGNWAPQVARNLILLYSSNGETVLDPFMGSGTTIIECKLLGRKCIGVDINYESVILAWSRIDFSVKGEPPFKDVSLFLGDARNLDKIEDDSIDLIATHPPYANIIRYGAPSTIDGDLSGMGIKEYLENMRLVATEFFRVLKPGKSLAIMIGDTRVKKHVVPLGFLVMKTFLERGFILREHIIKIQHNMVGSIVWRRRKNDFLLLSHEHIFVFRKPNDSDDIDKYELSSLKLLEL